MGWLWREYSDFKFVEGIRSGKEDVQRRFYFRCQECFRKNSACYDIPDDERKDLFQDSFVILWDKVIDGQIYTEGDKVYAVKRGGPAEVPDLVGYFMRIVKNLYLETLRSRGRILEIPEESDGRFAGSAWDALLMAKGLLLASDKDASKIVRSKGTTEDRELFYKLTSLQRTLSSMEGRPGSDPAASAELCREILAADSRLAGQCAAYGGIGSFLRTDADAVKAALSDNDVIVDMFDYKFDDGTHPYVAYIVRKESEHPLLVRLCENVRAGDAPMEFRDALEAAEVKAFADNLSSMLRPGDNVFLVPSGDFHLIPVESVVMSDGRRFGEAYNIVRLSSARDAVAAKQLAVNPKKRMEVSLFGGLDYGSSDEYSPLPATSEEVVAIRKALGKKALALEYSGEEGTPEAVMSLDGNSPDILHFATHGFWYASCGPAFNKAESYRRGMNMSGLVLSGGRRITAADISTLDLSGTTLAVLSACQTGQGHVTPEGVFGLQRAFKKAGVRYILVNVGEASDVASSLFMKEFYSSLRKTGDVREAFGDARAAVRERYPDPFYWAGFLLLD